VSNSDASVYIIGACVQIRWIPSWVFWNHSSSMKCIQTSR